MVLRLKTIDDLHLLASKGHRPVSYRELWGALKEIDSEVDDVRLIYSRELRPIDKYGGFKGAGMLKTLMEWHKSNPVDARERARKEKVYLIHGHRNPFVDYPRLIPWL
jgi:endonuclease I